MKNNWLKEACIIAVAIIVLGFFLKCGIDNFVNKDRIVSVKGLAEVEVPANKVIWPIVFSEMGNDLPALYNRINSTAGKVTDYLKNNGIMESDISAGAPKAVDLQAERYVSQQKPYRYIVTMVITVTSSQVELVRKLIASQGELLKEGIVLGSSDYNYNDRVTYEYTLFNDLKPQMIQEATKNARMAAQQFAEDSESKLGKIMWASQGQFTITDRDSNTPHIKKIRVVTSVNYSLKN